MSLKKTLLSTGVKLLADPRLQKFAQDERVVKALMQMMTVPGKVQGFTTAQIDKLAKMMNLATEDEVRALQRTVRRLEAEISQMERERSERKR